MRTRPNDPGPTDCLPFCRRGFGALHPVSAREAKAHAITDSPQLRPLLQTMNMIGMLESRREVNGKVTAETRFYIGSIGADVGRFTAAARGHWDIENDLHWSLDVAFREDDSRVRETRARENRAVLRHIAHTRLKRDTKTKLGIKNKRLRARWDERHLEELLFEAFPATEEAPSTDGPNISAD